MLDVDDARVAGDYRSIIQWGALDADSGVQEIWGLVAAWNEGGTWDGTWTGWIDSSDNHVIDLVEIGTGDYSALALSARQTAPRDDTVWRISGTIDPDSDAVPPGSFEPNPGPEAVHVSGTRSCGEVAMEPVESTVEGVIEARAEVDLCSWEMSDERLTGLDTTFLSADRRVDGPTYGWGSISLKIGGSTVEVGDPFGGWLGSYQLQREADGYTTVVVSLRGIGSLEGLAYEDVETGSGGAWTVDGWIEPAAPAP